MSNLVRNEIIIDHEMSSLVKVRYLSGNLFSRDNGGNEIGVRCSFNGEPNSLAGATVSANVIRADGSTVAITTGSILGVDNNIALVNLTQACYEVPGVISIVIKVAKDSRVTTIGAFVTNVYESATDTIIDPGTILPSIQTLISQINTAVSSIPADYSSLWTSLAPAFSTSATYIAGQYTTYNGKVYKFTADHSGAWNSSHVTAVNVGSELSSKADLRVVAPPFYNETDYVIGQYVTYNGKLWRFTADHPAGVWNSSHVTEDFVGYELHNIDTNWRSAVLNLSGQKTDLTVIAPAFYEGTDYVKGQYVIYYGKLYRFDVNHSAGAWNSLHATEVYIGSQLNNIDANWRAEVVDLKADKANLSIIASQFYADVAYYTGQYVIHDGKLYKFTSDHPAGAWNSAHVTEDFIGFELSNIDANWRAEVVDLKTGKTNLTVIAPPFYADTEYYKGQYVTHDGKCYKFTSDHPAGAWNTSHVAEVYIGSELSNIDANWRAEVIEVKLGKTNLTVIAPPFYADTTYYKGQYVTHDGKCYKFTSDHPAAAWNSGHVTEVYIGSELSNIDANWRAEVVNLKNQKTDLRVIAPAFYQETNYVTGQYVTHDGKLYRFTSDHPAGAWNSAHVIEDFVGYELFNIDANWRAGIIDLRGALNDINNNVFKVSAYSGTITGTGIVTVNINTVPAGTYNLSIERVTSTDTDYPKCVIALQNGSTTIKSLTVERNTSIQQTLALDSAINKITVYASQTAGGSTGDTVTVENMQIYNDSALGQRLSEMEDDIAENASALADVSTAISGKASSSDVEQLGKLVSENATDYMGGWSQGYWSNVTTIWNNANVCCNTVPVSIPAKAILEIAPNGQYVLIQDGTNGTLAQTSCLFDGVNKNASVSYQTANKIETIPTADARTLFIRIAKNSSANTAFLPSEVLATIEIRYADDTKDKAEIGSYNINKTDLQDGSLNYTTGSEEANQNILRTGFIPVESGEIYEIYSNRDLVNDVAYIFEYASDKSFIRYNTSLANKSWWKMSDTTKFIRIRTQSASTAYPKPDKDTLVIAVDKWYRRNTFNEDALLKGYDAFSVVGRQKDVYPHVCASAGYGLHNNGIKNSRKMFSVMLTTDVHYCASALMAAVDYMNETPSIDCGICLGDIQSGNFGQNPSDWYVHAVNKSNKPFFTVIGNHDGGEGSALSTAGSTQAVFETFVEPTIDKIGISDLDTIYYAKTFTEYGIVLIVLNDFDLPDTLSDSTHYLVPRNTYDFVSQAQVNWLINTLRNVPSGYHVMIARHDSPSAAISVESVWTQPGMIAEGCGAIYSGDIVPDIVNAWINGSSLSHSYSPISAFASLGDITVNADFSSRGEGVFIGYIQGHTHTDVHAKDTKYPDQNVFVVTTTANDLYQGFRSDLPRVRGTKMDECFTVLSVDKTNRAVNVVRVGSCITSEMTNRVMYRFTY